MGYIHLDKDDKTVNVNFLIRDTGHIINEKGIIIAASGFQKVGLEGVTNMTREPRIENRRISTKKLNHEIVPVPTKQSSKVCKTSQYYLWKIGGNSH